MTITENKIKLGKHDDGEYLTRSEFMARLNSRLHECFDDGVLVDIAYLLDMETVPKEHGIFQVVNE
tara:strand:+ start:176 stop:373 length:198 start_codon:yes stop_codon:yes gene_type:complete